MQESTHQFGQCNFPYRVAVPRVRLDPHRYIAYLGSKIDLQSSDVSTVAVYSATRSYFLGEER